LRAIVSSALPTLSIEDDELFDRKLILSDSAVSPTIWLGLSRPFEIVFAFAWMTDASLSLRADVRAEFGTLELPMVVNIAGPLLPSFEMAALAPGDLLLLSVDAPVTLGTAERTAHGRLTPAPLRMRVLSISDLSPETPMSIEPDTAAATPDGSTMANHPIPLMVELASITVPLSTLSGLAPGSVLSLGPAGESLPVRLTVGGRAVAIGELVAVGEGYGVLIEKRAN